MVYIFMEFPSHLPLGFCQYAYNVTFYICLGFLGDISGKEFPCQFRRCRDMSSILGAGSSQGVGNDTPLQYSCLEKYHEQGSLAGCSPWGCKESDMTEHIQTLIWNCLIIYPVFNLVNTMSMIHWDHIDTPYY